MIRRHPHVFNPENNEKSYSWDELKAKEKKNIQKSVLDGVSKGFTCFSRPLTSFKKRPRS